MRGRGRSSCGTSSGLAPPNSARICTIWLSPTPWLRLNSCALSWRAASCRSAPHEPKTRIRAAARNPRQAWAASLAAARSYFLRLPPVYGPKQAGASPCAHAPCCYGAFPISARTRDVRSGPRHLLSAGAEGGRNPRGDFAEARADGRRRVLRPTPAGGGGYLRSALTRGIPGRRTDALEFPRANNGAGAPRPGVVLPKKINSSLGFSVLSVFRTVVFFFRLRCSLRGLLFCL